MQTILIANPKGGSGKTTLATNIAGWLAGKRQRVVLADHDPQQSSTHWLARRPALFPKIVGLPPNASKHDLNRLDAQWCVVDSAAGMRDDLKGEVRAADVMLIPVSPSVFDMAATARFVANVSEMKSVKQGAPALGLVAMRVDGRTRSAEELETFLRGLDLPLVAHLRDTQVYVHCARDGASVFDLPRSRGEHDWEEWKPLTRWIARHVSEKVR